MRHVEAEAKAPGMEDADRKLTEAGKRVIDKVAEGLKDEGVKFDIIFTSPLLRARETAEIARDLLVSTRGIVETNALLVGSSPNELVAEVGRHKGLRSVLFVGHEPHLGRCIAWLTNKDEEETKLKKGACARLEVASLEKGKGQLIWIKRPEEF